MAAKLVPTVRTTYTSAQVVKAFVEGWKRLYNQVPKKESIGVIYAQNALETGLTKAMWNNNIGNVKYLAKPNDTEDIEYCMLANTWEIVKGKKVIFQPPHPATWFRSFKTLSDGVEHHFQFLKNNRYKDSWVAVEKGDPALFAHLLKLKGYYTAPESDYIKLMKYHFNTFMRSKDFDNAVKSLPVTEPVIVTPPPVVADTQPTPDEPPPITELPKDYTPIDTVPENSENEVKTFEITSWQKFEVGLYNFLGAMPWIKLIDWLTEPKKS